MNCPAVVLISAICMIEAFGELIVKASTAVFTQALISCIFIWYLCAATSVEAFSLCVKTNSVKDLWVYLRESTKQGHLFCFFFFSFSASTFFPLSIFPYLTCVFIKRSSRVHLGSKTRGPTKTLAGSGSKLGHRSGLVSVASGLGF